MHLLNKLLWIVLVIHPVANAQNIEIGPEIKNNYKLHTFAAVSSPKYLLHWDCLAPGRAGYIHRYHALNLETGTLNPSGDITLESGNLDGQQMEFFVEGEFIFELVRFIRTGVIFKSKFALIKRSIADYKIVGEIKWIADFGISGATNFPKIRLNHNQNGLWLLYSGEGNEEQHKFIASYDFDLNERWKTDLEFVADEIQPYDYSLDEAGNVLIRLQLNNPQSLEVDIAALAVDNDGNATVIRPVFQEEIVFSAINYHYDHSRNILTGVFLITEMIDERKLKFEGQGYAFYQWDQEGNILNSRHKMFTYGDVWDANFRNYLTIAGVNTNVTDNDTFPQLKYPAMKLFPEPNGNFIVKIHNLYHYTDNVFPESWLFFELNNKGEMTWKNVVPRPFDKTDFLVNGYTGEEIFILQENILYGFYKDYAACFDNGRPQLPAKLTFAEKENKILATMMIDCTTGEINYEQTAVRINPGYEPRKLYKIENTNQLLIEYTNGKLLKVVNLNFSK